MAGHMEAARALLGAGAAVKRAAVRDHWLDTQSPLLPAFVGVRMMMLGGC